MIRAIHGPFEQNARAYKNRILKRVDNGECGCRMCEERGRTAPRPDRAVFSRRPMNVSDPEGFYLCSVPANPMRAGGC